MTEREKALELKNCFLAIYWRFYVPSYLEFDTGFSALRYLHSQQMEGNLSPSSIYDVLNKKIIWKWWMQDEESIQEALGNVLKSFYDRKREGRSSNMV